MATLTVTVSLDDEWASGLEAAKVHKIGSAIWNIGRSCAFTPLGRVKDPNGNTIGTWEVTED